MNNSPEQTGREAAPAENGATISEREARIRDYLKTTQDDPFYTGDMTYLLVILDAERLMIQHLKSALREIEPWASHHACNNRSVSEMADRVYKACVESRKMTR